MNYANSEMFIKNVTAAARWTYASECGVHIPYGLSLELKVQNTDQELETRVVSLLALYDTTWLLQELQSTAPLQPYQDRHLLS
jgi:hypothetical protein